jgi:hypothetical protein
VQDDQVSYKSTKALFIAAGGGAGALRLRHLDTFRYAKRSQNYRQSENYEIDKNAVVEVVE